VVTKSSSFERFGWLGGALLTAPLWGCGGVADRGEGADGGATPVAAACGKGAIRCEQGAGASSNTGASSSGGNESQAATGGDSGGTGKLGESGGSGALGSGGAGESGPPSAQPKSYSGHGFVVHEWGTDTIVVGSDGSLQRGLHHEEEDLPGFVYDRVKAGTLLGTMPSVTIKMETPVTYFYSDQPLSVQASVSFPKGVLTQWYPQVTAFSPWVAAPGSVLQGMPATYADPALDLKFPFLGELCRQNYSTFHDGKLDWGKVEVLPRGTAAPKFPEASLDEFSWSYARAVDSNTIRTGTGEAERFLFYRGLGDFDLPVKVTAGAAGKVTLTNKYAEPVPRVFVLNVDHEHGAFNERAAGIAPGASLEDAAPSLAGAAGLDSYAEALGARVTDVLDGSGLFHDEAVAMVNTWKRQWFRTPGVRLLYLIPQSWTEQSIPLSLSPAPEELLRVMLIRVEVISPEQEAQDVAASLAFDSAPASAAAHFQALGRFAEPRLRRALSLSPSAAGDAYLAQIQTSRSSLVSGQ
jgi:hypothetical protein